ncbi:protoporphyrinogen oxidase [Ectothiorhodospira lacustris]|uniref:protoporphyrinogen oxidase n=1 Tax=Ectothiorhodospira lacustris TaxID=2899127 RepID=UPI001EE8E9C9|nr:protoporphyrinogen oxidase [Ectothiorhodospira lacustris]MCG5511256.1 protoporphyrinogen oxidase [Ectothiorhodospira lacustris]MCG5522984.1 protoporphyrinogen oxidase [Ectothiorhodospira lacustris]
MRVAIIGAGISGLATAFYLQRARSDAEIVIYEANPHVGGTLHTIDIEGFRFEEGGNGFLSNKPDMLQLVTDCGAGDVLMRSQDASRRRFIYTDRMHPMPDSPGKFLKTELLNWPQKLRVMGELFIRPKRDDSDETLQSFGYRRLGKAFTDIFLDAMTAGIYGTTADRVSVKAAFPLVTELERKHGGLFKGMIARRKQSAGPGGVLMSFKGGMNALTEHLHKTIKAEWHLDTPVEAVVQEGKGFRVEAGDQSATVDQVILAVPAHVAARILAGLDQELERQLDAVNYAPIAVVGFGWKHLDHPLDGFGVLTTAAARMPFLGILWDSSIFPDRAPEGMKCVRVMLGGQRDPHMVDLDDDALIAHARDGVSKALGIDVSPDVQFVKKWPRGLPGYPVGHIEAMDRLMAHVGRYPGLHLTGNAYRGIAMNDCARNGRLTGEAAALLGEKKF